MNNQEHLGCPAYPNCDEDPLGCCEKTPKKEIEWYGHKDKDDE